MAAATAQYSALVLGATGIEITYPQAFCRAAKAGGARVCGLMTAADADPKAGMKYAKIIGEKEKAVESIKFDFLGVLYHAIHKNDLARAMVAQSEQAFFAIAQGKAPKEGIVKILEYQEMEPFFVKGEIDAP